MQYTCTLYMYIVGKYQIYLYQLLKKVEKQALMVDILGYTYWYMQYTWYVHCWEISNLFVSAFEESRKASLDGWHSLLHLLIYAIYMYVHCWEISNLFVAVSEKGRKVSIWWVTFLVTLFAICTLSADMKFLCSSFRNR
jgi:hypothetical protein